MRFYGQEIKKKRRIFNKWQGVYKKNPILQAGNYTITWELNFAQYQPLMAENRR